ncbi:hypothetical protein NQ314_003679 [Rhamnusium bicolor]|uniref:DDE Tnp4 domain-containing protein n=1 Tax=Rhamnusium bicolor TaxID=1586634 RepID=A0AAV8ZN31_9CUCU|nr:hypothetical protein NQ314_003679 [Rhamnusium bicolor]
MNCALEYLCASIDTQTKDYVTKTKQLLVLATLHFLAQGSYQRSLGKDLNIALSQSVICDSNLKILGANARYSGSTHDSAIWSMSSINRSMIRNFERDDHTPLAPIPDAPDGSPDARYTLMLCRARNVIERFFGVLTQRFCCLLKHQVLRYNHATSALIFHSCCVLYNICIERNLVNYEDAEEFENEEDDVNANQAMDDIDIPQDVLAAARHVQNHVIAELNRI